MSKIIIKEEAPRDASIYSHLEPLVDSLIVSGNTLAKGFRWGSNREGFFCYFQNPIDFELLKKEFELPPTIYLGEERNVVYCEKSGCVIQTIPE
jgi:hypothetical protein